MADDRYKLSCNYRNISFPFVEEVAYFPCRGAVPGCLRLFNPNPPRFTARSCFIALFYNVLVLGGIFIGERSSSTTWQVLQQE